MCDGRVGDACTAEVWLNFQGSTSNGFAPYDLIYFQVDQDSAEKNKWKNPKVISGDEVPDEIIPITYETTPCNEQYIDPITGLVSK